MKWDEEEVVKYVKWYETEPGSFALACEKRLIQSLVSAWPRRNRTLLDVGCGPGIFTRFLWDSGFDVSALDSSQAMLSFAAQSMPQGAELHLGRAEHLPYDDRYFDYVTLFNLLEFVEDPLCVLREAFRVAKRGVLITFLNRWSLYYLASGMRFPFSEDRILRRIKWFSWPELLFMVHRISDWKRIVSGSVLLGPECTWKKNRPCRYLNETFIRLVLGGFAGMRIDANAEKPVTPLLLWKKEPAAG